MSNDSTQTPPVDTITIKFSNFLKYTLGSEESFPLEYEDALVLKHVIKNPSVYIQMEDLDTNKELLHPLMWNSKRWMENLQRRAKMREDSELRRKGVDKNRENITSIARFLQKKYSLPTDIALQIATETTAKGDKKILENILGIKIEHLTPEEQKALGEYWRVM